MATFIGPMVCLMNEFSASDGDLFPYRFRHYKLGPAHRQAKLGRRRRHSRLAAAARRRLAEQAGVLALRRRTARSGSSRAYGVDPDIVVDNDPAKEYAGDDQQLNKAIDVLMAELKKNPTKLPGPPPYLKK